jgi:hypothetical protein
MEDKWTDKEEDFLEKLEKQANVLHKHYAKEYTYYQGLAKKFNVPILVISAINALTAIALNDFLEQRYVSILNAVLSAGTGVLGSIQLYLKINEKMTKALNASVIYHKLALKISKEITLDRPQRSSSGQLFLNECFAEFTTTFEQGNPIERKLVNHLRLDDSESDTESKSSLGAIAARLIEMSRGSSKSSMSSQGGSPSSREDTIV